MLAYRIALTKLAEQYFVKWPGQAFRRFTYLKIPIYVRDANGEVPFYQGGLVSYV